LVYPEGIDRSWNMGLKFCPMRDFLPTVDDVGFISALIDTLYSHYTIDMQRIYCCGFSTGGEMTYRLACELGERFAAVAVVGGSLYDSAENWHPIRPMSILHIHGTKDQYSFYYHPDSTYNSHSAEEWSINKTLDYWIERNQCSLKGDTVALPDLVPSDLCNVQKITFSEDSYNTEVIHYKIINGGHAWPGSPANVPYWETEGNRNMDFSANAIIWEFFKKFENPLINTACGKSMELNLKYIEPQEDTLVVSAHLTNHENHPVTVYAIINSDEHTFQDSIELFDDGLHEDGDVSDNIFCEKKLLSGLKEDYYNVKLYTNDLTNGTTHLLPFKERFTTIGPVQASAIDDQYVYERQYIKLILKNEGSYTTASNLKVTISTTDPRVKEKAFPTKEFPDLAAGITDTSSFTYYFNYAEGYVPDSTIGNPILFNYTIYSNEIPYWTDTLEFVATLTGIDDKELNTIPQEYALEQNFPNPFNPSTTIKYSIPSSVIASEAKQSQEITSVTSFPRNDNVNVQLKVYDILGREVATLVNEQQKAGYYEVQFTSNNVSARGGQALTSGVYFYQLTAGKYTETKKMILLR